MNAQNIRLQSGITRGQAFHIDLDGQAIIAYPGETLATVLIAAGHRAFRQTPLADGRKKLN